MNDTVLFFIAQSIIIVGAIVTAYVRTQIAIAELRKDSQQTMINTEGLKNDHGELAKQVGGISRAVARLEGRNEAAGD